jgi:hypothetical protein
MVGRLLRAALFCATLLVAWTIARPALAAPAPFCDDRGATALAAAPALEAPDEAIRRAKVGCGRGAFEADPLMAWLGPSHDAPTASDDGSSHACLANVAATVPVAAATLLDVEPVNRPCAGTRSRVERPPRA